MLMCHAVLLLLKENQYSVVEDMTKDLQRCMLVPLDKLCFSSDFIGVGK